jgi:hypothetical protein
MALAATTANRIHAQDILITAGPALAADHQPEDACETDGDRLSASNRPGRGGNPHSAASMAAR